MHAEFPARSGRGLKDRDVYIVDGLPGQGSGMKRFAAILMVLALLSVSAGAGAKYTPPYPVEPTADVWRTYDPELHYFYQQLTDAEKRRFSSRYDCVALGKPDLWQYPCGDLSYLSIARVNYVLLFDCPELMYLPDDYADSLALIRKPDDAFCASHPVLMAERLFLCMEALDRIRQEPEWGESEFEKELAADRYFVRHCQYRTEEDLGRGEKPDERLRTAYGALVYGKAVCEGYAAAMTLAMRCFGIPCVRTNGVYYSEKGQASGHSWNIVQIDGEWYHEDPTWNDTDDEAEPEDFFPFFNNPSNDVYAVLRNDPLRGELNLRNPFCMSDRENYYVRKGQSVGENWQKEIAAIVSNARSEGKHAVGIRFPDSVTRDSALETIRSSGLFLFGLMFLRMGAEPIWGSKVLYLFW